MRSTHKVRLAVGVAAATCVSVVGLSPATVSADPQKADTVELSCDGGLNVDAAVFSNGRWSPALDTNSNAVYHPVEFREQTVVVTDADGNVVFQGSAPDIAKNGNRLGVDLIECQYFSSFEDFDPEVGALFGEASGIVVVFVTE